MLTLNAHRFEKVLQSPKWEQSSGKKGIAKYSSIKDFHRQCWNGLTKKNQLNDVEIQEEQLEKQLENCKMVLMKV